MVGMGKNDKISREGGIDFCFFLVARLTRGGDNLPKTPIFLPFFAKKMLFLRVENVENHFV